MFCPKCGTNAGNSNYCPSCGTKLPTIDELVNVEPAIEVDEAGVPFTLESVKKVNKKKKKGSFLGTVLKFFIVIILLSLVANKYSGEGSLKNLSSEQLQSNEVVESETKNEPIKELDKQPEKKPVQEPKQTEKKPVQEPVKEPEKQAVQVPAKEPEKYPVQEPAKEIETKKYTVSGIPNTAKYIEVSNVDELLKAIASNTIIYLKEGSYIFDDALNFGTNTSSYSWASWNSGQGYSLVLSNLKNIAFVSDKKVTIECKSRYSNVISLINCVNIHFEGVTVTHHNGRSEYDTSTLYCDGSTDIFLKNVSLPGGKIGISFMNSRNLSLDNVRICDNGLQAILMMYSDELSIKNSSFYNNATEGSEVIFLHKVIDINIDNTKFDKEYSIVFNSNCLDEILIDGQKIQ